MTAAPDPALRLGGIALSNGLVVVSSEHWAAAIREADGTITVASGKKPRLPGTGEGQAAARGGTGSGGATEGLPLIRGLGRFAESLMVLGAVKKRLPGAQLPFENRRVAAALAASMAGASAVRVMAPRSVLVQEAGTALAAFIPAVLSVKNSVVSGYHGAEHKVIGAREEALRAAARERAGAQGGGAEGSPAAGGRAAVARDTAALDLDAATLAGDTATLTGDAAAAAKEHDRCGSNLVGPFLVATVLTNLLARGRSGQKTPLRSAVAGAASLGIALEAMRWATKHADSPVARVMMMPGRAIQKNLTTSEPTPEQLEVGERALAELLRLEKAGS
jgi:uncharacterized protein YqhQ